MLDVPALSSLIQQPLSPKAIGRVVAIRGSVILARIPLVAIGDICVIKTLHNTEIRAQVVSFEDDYVYLAPFSDWTGLAPGTSIEKQNAPLAVPIYEDTVGSVLDALGQPRDISSYATKDIIDWAPLDRLSPDPLTRTPICEQLLTGVRAIDTLCSVGYGQRLGLFASAGLGKSTLLGMFARNAAVDLTVIGLIGERGREVNDFLQESLTSAGLKKSIVVISTSDESPLRRFIAAKTATAIAEYYRDRGKKVLLLVDSLTRVARAIRDIGLSTGETPVRHGYTPSVYTELPKLLERGGTNAHGSISAVYTVLTNQHEDIDPLADEVKSLLDGHFVLHPAVVASGVRPALDLTFSVSRLLQQFHETGSMRSIEVILKILGRLKNDKELLILGGTPDPDLRACLAVENELKDILTQKPFEVADYKTAVHKLGKVVEQYTKISVAS